MWNESNSKEECYLYALRGEEDFCTMEESRAEQPAMQCGWRKSRPPRGPSPRKNLHQLWRGEQQRWRWGTMDTPRATSTSAQRTEAWRGHVISSLPQMLKVCPEEIGGPVLLALKWGHWTSERRGHFSNPSGATIKRKKGNSSKGSYRPHTGCFWKRYL